jgi:BlaR1 peptidase M56
MAHIRRFDWPMLVAARISVALLWFNPLVWLLNRTLVRRGEMAADEVAVRGIARADYAEALLSFATAPAARGVATGMALWPNALAERITHIAIHRQRRGSRAVPAAALMCAAIAAPALAAARLVPAAPAGERVTRPIAAQARPVGPELRTPASSGGAVAPVPRRAAVQTADTGRDAPSSVARSAESAPVAQPLPVPVAPAAPAVRIVGRNGAEVSVGPQGTTIIGEQIEIPPAGGPIVVTGSERPEWAVEAARDLRISAAEMRSGAREVELTAELPGVSAGKRAEIRKRAGEMRTRADEFEARARALGGPGG